MPFLPSYSCSAVAILIIIFTYTSNTCKVLSFTTLNLKVCRHRSPKSISSITLPRATELETKHPFDKTNLLLIQDPNLLLFPINPRTLTQRRDVFWEKICIFLLSWSLACVSVDKYNALRFVYPGMGYPEFVKVSRTLLKGKAEDIKSKIVDLLVSLIPTTFRTIIFEFCQKNPKWISEKSSEFMGYGLLNWLVGPVDRINANVPQQDGTVETWMSGVKVKECRYLVESGCKSACLHLCKGPTQSFFNEKLGLKLHMKPDFKDCSCEMLFGVAPPTVEEDPAYGEPCFSTCSMIKFKKKKKIPFITSLTEIGVDSKKEDDEIFNYSGSEVFNKCS